MLPNVIDAMSTIANAFRSRLSIAFDLMKAYPAKRTRDGEMVGSKQPRKTSDLWPIRYFPSPMASQELQWQSGDQFAVCCV